MKISKTVNYSSHIERRSLRKRASESPHDCIKLSVCLIAYQRPRKAWLYHSIILLAENISQSTDQYRNLFISNLSQ